MRGEAEINADLARALAAYREAVAVKPAHEAAALSDRAKALQAELSACLACGASPCPCGAGGPHGMLRTPAHTHKGKDVPAVYEVLCLACGLRSRAETPRGAALLWEAGERKKKGA